VHHIADNAVDDAGLVASAEKIIAEACDRGGFLGRSAATDEDDQRDSQPGGPVTFHGDTSRVENVV
jgi:hypothetical protein